MEKLTRKLAVVLATDCVAFSRMMDQNEELTLQNIKLCRQIIDPTIEENGGRIFHTAGDSVIAEFNSVVDAVNAAIEFQKMLHQRNDNVGEDSQMQFRVGIHLDDVIIEGDNVYGNGVNVAARLEALCEPGCILISRNVQEKIVKRIQVVIDSIGNTQLKNIEGDFPLYQITPLEKSAAAKNEQHTDPVDTFSPADYSPQIDDVKTGKPRLMLIPFRNVNKSDDNDFLVEGIADDIITELSMINSIEIMSRNATFSYAENPVAVNQLAKQYALDYLVTGSIRSAGNRVRISAELGDAESGDAIWSERYDRTLDDVFEIQDEIVNKMASTILNEIEVTSLKRAKRKPTENMTSYEYLLRGKHHKRLKTKEDANEAVRLFTQAIELDPNNGRAYCERCCTWGGGMAQNWFSESNEELTEKILTTLDEASKLTEHDWDCHRLLCAVSTHFENYESALRHGQAAYNLNPNNPLVLAHYGESLIFNGEYDTGIELLRKAQKLDPTDPEITESIVWGLYACGDYTACIEHTEMTGKLDAQSWLLRIASLGALMMNEQRDRELEAFAKAHPDAGVESQWEALEFNNSAIKQATNHYLFDSRQSIGELINETKTEAFAHSN